MRPWVAVPHQRLADSDQRVLAAINQVMPNEFRINALHAIFDGAARFLSGVPELDPYGARESADYLGLHTVTIGSAPPTWPAGDGKRVFAYLNSGYRHLDRTLQALSGSSARVLIYVFGGDESLMARYRGSRLGFTSQALDLSQVVAECDLCVCHGNSGTTLGMLHGGRPVLVLPMHLEHFLLGRKLESAGAGCVVHPDEPEPDIGGTLRKMLGADTYGQKARDLAARYAEGSVGTMANRAIACIEALSAQAARSPE